MVEKPNRVCHFGSSVSHQGAADAKNPDLPLCQRGSRRARAAFKSVGGNTNIHGRAEKKGESVFSSGAGGGADTLRLPAVVNRVQFLEYFDSTSQQLIYTQNKHTKMNKQKINK